MMGMGKRKPDIALVLEGGPKTATVDKEETAGTTAAKAACKELWPGKDPGKVMALLKSLITLLGGDESCETED